MLILVCCLCSTVGLLYWYSTRSFTYWKERGVIHDPPIPGFGNSASQIFARKSNSQFAADLYQKYPNERIVGFYKFTQPELLIRDPELIKDVFASDFAHFYARAHIGSESGQQLEPLRKQILVADGDLWRLLRQGCSPAFTMGKLKAMFPLILERAERLQELTLAKIERGSSIDAKDLMCRFTLDFIGACVLGIKAEALDEDNSPLRKLGYEMFHLGPREMVIFFLKELFPGKLNLKYFGKFEKYFINLVRDIQKFRNHKPSARHDFIDLLMEMRDKGKIEVDSMERTKLDGTPERVSLEVDDEIMAAQVFSFVMAGFETSASSTSYALHELAFNPDKQKKVQDEIDRVLSKHDQKLSWDAIRDMHYLEWTLKESLRILPPVGVMGRVCRRKYNSSKLNVAIEEGVRVRISVQALHNDPAFWENPEEFRPERFSPEEFNETRTKHVYLPFGLGPRSCIGERLGVMQSMAGLAAILSRFSVEPAPASRRHPLIDPKSNITQGIIGGLPLKFKERKIHTIPNGE